jgi:hypothetical protein
MAVLHCGSTNARLLGQTPGCCNIVRNRLDFLLFGSHSPQVEQEQPRFLNVWSDDGRYRYKISQQSFDGV